MYKGVVLVAGVVLLVALFAYYGGGGDDRDPVLDSGVARVDAVGEPPLAGTEAASVIVAGIYGTVQRDGCPTVSRVELRFLREADPALPPFFLSMLPPVFFLRSPFSGREPDRVVSSDAQGRFSFDEVPVGSYEVRAVCDDGQRGRTTATVNRPGQRVRADLAVEEGEHAFRGRAQFRDGSAFDGWVALTVEDERLSAWVIMVDDLLVALPPMTGYGARTDSDGNFLIPGLKPGAYHLSCLSDGRFRAVGPWVAVPRDEDYVFVVDRGLVALSGKVIAEDDDTPVSGATVWAAGHTTGGLDALTLARSDEEGNFTLMVPAEARGVLADARGFRPCSFRVPDEESETVIKLARAALARGVVVTQEGGKSVAGITVFALPREVGLADRILPLSYTVTDAAGRFAFDGLPPGIVSFGARGKGWVSSALGALGGKRRDPGASVLSPGSETEIQLRVIRSALILGVVADEDGNPVSGAVLRVTQRDSTSWNTTANDLLASTGTSGGDGRFSLPEIVPGIGGVLVANAPGYEEVRLPLSPVGSGESREIEIRLPLEGSAPAEAPAREKEVKGDLTIRGTVRFEDGSVPYRAEVSLTGPGEVERRGCPVDDQGGFLVTGLPAGTCRILAIAYAEGWSDADACAEGWFDAEAEVQTGARGIELVLKPEHPTAVSSRPAQVTTFRVLDPEGRTVDRGDLVVHHRGAHRWLTDWNQIKDGKVISQQVDTEEGLWIDVYRARSRSGIRLAAGSALVGPIAAGQNNVEIHLPKERRITGIVCDANGTAVPGVRVHAEPVYPFDIYRGSGSFDRGEARTHSETFAGPQGKFELRRLGDLDYELMVDVPPAFFELEPIRARAGAKNVRLVLTRGIEQRITVIDDGGAPVPRASIRLLSLQNGVWSSCRNGADADVRGVALITGLDPARKYILRVSPPDDRPALLHRKIREWAPQDMTIELVAGLFIQGVVRDSDGNAAGDAAVCGRQWDQPGSRELRVTVAGDGTFRIGPFHPGKVRLLTMPWRVGSWDTTERWQQVEAGAEDVELVLKTRWDLKILLDGIEGDSRWELEVRLAQDSEWPDSLSWRTDRWNWRGDRLVFTNLEPGNTYSFYVRHPETGRFALRRGITRETPEITLVLQPGQTLSGQLILPADPPPHRVLATGPGFEVRGQVEKDGTFEIRGVPSGSCFIGAWTRRGNTEGTSYHRVENGESITIDLRDQ